MDRDAAVRASRCHDYAFLIKRWRSAARAKRLNFVEYGTASGFPLFCLESRLVAVGAPYVVLSAGIHGDEPAGTEGVLEWFLKTQLQLNLLILPCLNPWGLTHNSRFDERGRDLNRSYKPRASDPTRSHMRLLAGKKFDLALTLHEDYDARGVYVYEISHERRYWGEKLITAVQDLIPADTRSVIETSRAKSGVIRRKLRPGSIDIYPEALYLHFNHARRTYTFETPSEFGLDVRVAAQVRFMESAMQLLVSERRGN